VFVTEQGTHGKLAGPGEWYRAPIPPFDGKTNGPRGRTPPATEFTFQDSVEASGELRSIVRVQPALPGTGFESVASGPLVRSSYHADLLAGTVKPGEVSKAG